MNHLYYDYRKLSDITGLKSFMTPIPGSIEPRCLGIGQALMAVRYANWPPQHTIVPDTAKVHSFLGRGYTYAMERTMCRIAQP